MAYIETQKVSEIRKALKSAFPELKLSVKRLNHSKLDVTILSGPYKFIDREYQQINHNYCTSYSTPDVLQKITDICMNGNYDNSDIMTDYFEVGYYFSLSVGDWDKPYIQTAN